MKNFLVNERSKWLFIIVLVGISAGFTAKNVISYPTECLPEKAVEVSQLEESEIVGIAIVRDHK